MRKAVVAIAALLVTLGACSSEQVGTPTLFADANQLAQGVTDQTAKSKSAKFSIATSSQGQTTNGTGAGVFDGDRSRVTLTLNSGDGQVEARIVDKTLYLKLPESAGGGSLTQGKPWVKVTADGTDPLSKSVGGNLNQLGQQSDPSRILEQVRQAGTITKAEATQLDGQQATYYAVNLDFAKLADQSAAGLPKEAIQQLKGKVTTLPMELWLNTDRLPTQIRIDLSPVERAAGSANANGSVLVRYTDWGAPVDVQAPPAAEIGEFKLTG